VNERDGFYLTDVYSVWNAAKDHGRKFIVQTAIGDNGIPFEWERWRSSPSGPLISVKEIFEPTAETIIESIAGSLCSASILRGLDEAGYDVVKRKSDHG
jgi:hypothetical protein